MSTPEAETSGPQEPETTRDAAKEKRQRANRLTLAALVIGGVLLYTGIAWGLLHPRAESARGAPPTACIRSWNDAANGRVRERAQALTAPLIGTPRQRLWVGRAGGDCVVAAVLSDGSGMLWQRGARGWLPRQVNPTDRLYQLAGRAADRPNTIIRISAYQRLAQDPTMATLSAD